MLVGCGRERRGRRIARLGDVGDGDNLVSLLELLVVGGCDVGDRGKRLSEVG